MINPAKYDILKARIEALAEHVATGLYENQQGGAWRHWLTHLEGYRDALFHLDGDLWLQASDVRTQLLAYHRYLCIEQGPNLPRPSFQGWLIGTSVNVLRAA